jgi:hypothetical protein
MCGTLNIGYDQSSWGAHAKNLRYLNKQILPKTNRFNKSLARHSRKPRKSAGRKEITYGSQSGSAGNDHRQPTFFQDKFGTHENKYFNSPLTTYFASVSTTKRILDLCSPIVEGDDYNMREGREVKLRDLIFYGQLIGGQSNLGTDEQRNCFRISVVEAPTSWSSSSIDVSGPADCRLWGCQRILFDELFSLVSPGRDTVGYMPAGLYVDRQVRVRNHVNYAGSGAAADVGLTIFLVMVSDSAISPNPGFTNGNWALRFEDQ